MTASPDLLRTDLAPGLRTLGFTGSANTFVLPDPKVWRLLGIQRSGAHGPGRFRFTLNLLVVAKPAWEEYRTTFAEPLPPRPNPNLAYPATVGPTRIGRLMPGEDHWWHVTDRTRPDRLVQGVLTAVEDYALPFLRTATGQCRPTA